MLPDRKISPSPEETVINFWQQKIEQKIIVFMTTKKHHRLFIGKNLSGIPIFMEPKGWLAFRTTYQGITNDLYRIKMLRNFLIVSCDWHIQTPTTKPLENEDQENPKIVFSRWAVKSIRPEAEATLSFNGNSLELWCHLRTLTEILELYPPVTKEVLRDFDKSLMLKRKT